MNTREAYEYAYRLLRQQNVLMDYEDDWRYAFNRCSVLAQNAAFDSYFHRNDEAHALTRRQYRRILRRLEANGREHLKKHIYPFAFYGQF